MKVQTDVSLAANCNEVDLRVQSCCMRWQLILLCCTFITRKCKTTLKTHRRPLNTAKMNKRWHWMVKNREKKWKQTKVNQKETQQGKVDTKWRTSDEDQGWETMLQDTDQGKVPSYALTHKKRLSQCWKLHSQTKILALLCHYHVRNLPD